MLADTATMLEHWGYRLRLSQAFHEQTKFRERIPTSDPKDWPDEWRQVYFKGYPRLPAIALPRARLSKRISLVTALQSRQSTREYGSTPLALQNVATILHYAAGIRMGSATQGANRYYPSAGGRYPLEVYPIALNVEGLPRGIYHYYLKAHALETLSQDEVTIDDMLSTLPAEWMGHAGIVIVIAGVVDRSQIKYGERGYRHVLTEVGHMAQNIYLICSALQLACCSAGGFLDDEVGAAIDLDPLDEPVLGMLYIGSMPTEETS